MKGYLYYITNDINGKQYIGITNNIKRRLKAHKLMLNNNTHHSKKLQEDYNFYGSNHFITNYEEHEVSDYFELCSLEKKAIKKNNSFVDGYNGNSGGKLISGEKLLENESLDILVAINNFVDKINVLSNYYDVDRHTISDIKNNASWSHIQDRYNSLSDDEFSNLIQKVMIKYNFSEVDYCKNYLHENKRKLDKNTAIKILCINKYYKNIQKSIAEYLDISHTSIARLCRGDTYKDFYKSFLCINEETMKQIADYYYDEWDIDRIYKKRMSNQYKNGSRLLQEQVFYILCAREFLNITYQKIADKFGYNESSIRDIYKGRSYNDYMSDYLKLSKEEKEKLIPYTKLFFNIV